MMNVNRFRECGGQMAVRNSGLIFLKIKKFEDLIGSERVITRTGIGRAQGNINTCSSFSYSEIVH